MKNKKGFSIAEVLVAIMIFSVGILSVIQVFPLYKKISRKSEKSSIAVFLAQQKIEEVFSMDYDNISTGTFEPKAPVELTGPFSKYQRKTEVDFVNGEFQNDGSDLGLKKITSTVYWFEGGNEKSESLTTVITDK